MPSGQVPAGMVRIPGGTFVMGTDPGSIPALQQRFAIRFAGGAFRSVTTRRVIRGGSWQGAPINLRVSYRDSHPAAGAGPHVGFRCARE